MERFNPRIAGAASLTAHTYRATATRPSFNPRIAGAASLTGAFD